MLSRASGTSERIVQIAKGLASQGVKVTMSGAIEDNKEKLELENISLIRMPNRLQPSLRLLKWIVQLVASGISPQYDIVQIESFSFLRTFALYFLMRPFTRKFVIVFHDNSFHEDPRKRFRGYVSFWSQRLELMLFDISITPGSTVKKWFIKLHGRLARDKMVVLQNGVPIMDIPMEINNSELRKSFGLDPNVYIGLFFGAMTFKPNYDSAIMLFKQSKMVCEKFFEKTGKTLILAVAGIGSQGLPIDERFVSLGYIKDLNDLWALPDVIVFPHLPSFSGPHIKTIYALQSRKPVIATKDAVKGLQNLINKKHFLLFDVEKPDSLIDALVSLHQEEELGKRLALNSFVYSKDYTWLATSSSHIDLYKKVLKRN